MVWESMKEALLVDPAAIAKLHLTHHMYTRASVFWNNDLSMHNDGQVCKSPDSQIIVHVAVGPTCCKAIQGRHDVRGCGGACSLIWLLLFAFRGRTRRLTPGRQPVQA